MSSNLSLLDNFIILVYFGIVLYIGIYISRSKISNKSNYFLAGKNLGWFAIGSSLFATNISSEHLVGLAGAGSKYGLGVGHFEWLAAVILLILGWVFAPILLRANVYTVPQFFGKRFDDRSRIYLTLISIFSYLFTKIGVTLLAGSFVLKSVLGWNMFTSAVLMVLITGVYTVVGGLPSVIKTQIFQMIILIIGSILLSIFGLYKVGGFEGLIENLPPNFFEVFKSPTDSNLPWTGILLGAPILGIWYWCTDQYIVQRIFSAKDIKSAQKGTLLAALLKTIPIFFFIFPGLVAAVLYPNLKGDSAYSLLLSGNLLPAGIKGIVIAGLFAALMSSLASAFNSASSLIALDIYSFIRPKASESEEVLVGRLSTMLFVIIAIAIVPLIKMIDTHIYIHLQTIQAYIAPPIVSVFLFGIFWKKATSESAIYALLIGGILGLFRIILSSVDLDVIKQNTILNFYYQINYLHFALYLFLICSLVIVSISLLIKTEIIEENKISNYSISFKEISVTANTANFMRKKVSKTEITN